MLPVECFLLFAVILFATSLVVLQNIYIYVYVYDEQLPVCVDEYGVFHFWYFICIYICMYST